MHYRNLQLALAFLSASALSVSYVSANIIPLGGGWAAEVLEPASTSVTVDSVTPTEITIEIGKDFLDPPGVGNVIPASLIDFIQVGDDVNTVPKIIIVDEAITNLTGVAWPDFHWEVLSSGSAWFNVPESNDWSVAPYTSKNFTGVSGDHALGLDAFNGSLANGSSFFPGSANGELVIDVDLTPTDPVGFTFKQFATPEPATIALLAIGGLAVIRRRH